MQRISFLSTVPLFQGLSDQELEAMNQSACEKKLSPGQCLVHDAESADNIFLVWEGRIKLTKLSYTGKEQTIQLYGPGDLIGLFTLFTGSTFPAAAIALDSCRVLVFSRIRLERAAQHIPSLLVNLFYALANRQSECIRMVENMTLKETPQRLAAFLLYESQKNGNGSELTLDFSHKELSKILGTTPETLSRVLTRFTHSALIAQNGRSIQILDRKALENL